MEQLELIPYENPDEASVIGTLLLLGCIGYFVWCGIKYSQTGVWSWTPWRQPVARPIKQLTEHGVIRPPSDNSKEIISLIVP